MQLSVRHLGSAVNETLQYISDRNSGAIKPLDTGFPKLNEVLLGGLEWNRILTIAALSGGGKSLTLELLKRNIIERNQEQDFDFLCFDWEMPAVDQVVRNLISRTDIDVQTLYGMEKPISPETMQTLEHISEELKTHPVYICDTTGTPSDVWDTVMGYVETRKLAARNRGIIITLDHTLLTKGGTSDNEKSVVDELSKMFVALKKELIRLGVKVIIIMLSQLNRDIESEKRVMNPLLHYPNKNDIFAASSVYYCSDYVLVSHKPALINGIQRYYGPPRGTKYPRGLPVHNPFNPEQAMVYWHLIKNRFGTTADLMMLDNFKYSKVDEFIEYES